MEIRLADEVDLDPILIYDRHISRQNLLDAVHLNRVYIAENSGRFCGWLRYNLFWDNTPFLNMLYLIESERGKGGGKMMMEYWEERMRGMGYGAVMTSTQSDEYAQHFYTHLGYRAVGGFMQEDGAYEIIMSKTVNSL